ncbi:MAG: hypothetical protein QOJ95_2537, partial [Mycobacterium sp.]|nr:hypothetical protein [Mycobacterium sp.]
PGGNHGKVSPVKYHDLIVQNALLDMADAA